MRLFVIPAIYPWEKQPGLGVFVHEQNKALVKRGHQVIVLDATGLDHHFWTDKTCWRVNKNKKDSCMVYQKHTLGLMTSRLPKLAVATSLYTIKKLYKLAVDENGKPDLVVSHFSHPAGFATLQLVKEKKLPLVIIEHYSLFLEDYIHNYIVEKTKECILQSQFFICVSKSLRKSIEQKTEISGKIKVVNNLVDPKFVFHAPTNSGFYSFFSAGNLTSNKRFDLLINAFCISFASEEKVYLRIAGEGPEFEKLQMMIRTNHREHQISLLGRCSRDQMMEEYINCNCFSLLSEHETFGIVYREAMAIGRPIIATRNGGVEENWDDAFGYLLENDNIETVSQALVKMKTDGNFNGKRISEKCMSLYSADIVTLKLEDLFMKAIKMTNESNYV